MSEERTRPEPPPKVPNASEARPLTQHQMSAVYNCINCHYWTDEFMADAPGTGQTPKGMCLRPTGEDPPAEPFALAADAVLLTEPGFFCGAYRPNKETTLFMTDPGRN